MPLIRRRVPIAEHVLSDTSYVLLRDDGLPEVREIRDGVDRIISQGFVKIPLPPPDKWWELVDAPPSYELPHLSGWKLNMP